MTILFSKYFIFKFLLKFINPSQSACLTSPCGAQGRCVNMLSNTPGFNCLCYPGFYGNNCDLCKYFFNIYVSHALSQFFQLNESVKF